MSRLYKDFKLCRIIVSMELNQPSHSADHAKLYSSQNFSDLLDMGNSAALMLSQKGEVVYANKYFRQLFSLGTRELKKISIFEFLSPKEQSHLAAFLEGKRKSIKNKVFTFLIKKSIPLKARISLKQMSHKQKIYYLFVFSDQTAIESLENERNYLALEKQEREKIQKTYEHVISILENHSDACIALDNNWKFTFLNKHARNFTDNRNRTKLLGRSIFAELPWFKNTLLYQHLLESVKLKKPLRFEDYELYFQKWIKAAIFPSEHGLSMHLSDLTPIKEAQKAGRLSEHKYRLVVEHSADLISLVDLNGNYLYTSPSFKNVLGYKNGELVGRNRSGLIHREDAEYAQNNIKLTIETQIPQKYSIRFKHKNGKYLNIEGVSSAIFDDQEKPEMIVLVSHDATERKKLDDQKDEFLSITSHELKTPLTSIKGYNQILERILSDQKIDQALVYMNKIDVHTDKLSQLISDLLDVSRIQGGKLEYHWDFLSFDNLIKESLENVQQTTRTHNILMQGETNEMVYGDKLRLEQVLTNLLTNAVKYSPESDKVIINVIKNKEYVLLSVKDFGVGIPIEKVSHIFERFYRIEETSTRFSGLGIGLYISAEIIRRHNGSIWAESDYGKGSTFYVSLPIAKQNL